MMESNHRHEHNVLVFPTLEAGIAQAQGLLTDFISDRNLSSKIELAFGNQIDSDAARFLIAELAGDDSTALPRIEIRDESEINGANGAFASATNTIYLSCEFLLRNMDNLPTITAVLLAEIGHAIDFRLNASDTPGDEGELFSALVRGVELSEGEWQRIKAKDDGTDNNSFYINASELKTKRVLDDETQSIYSIRVRMTDNGDLYYEKPLTINVTNTDNEINLDIDGNIKQFEQTPYYLRDIDFINNTVGWAVGEPHWDRASQTYTATIIKTTDGGATWIVQKANSGVTLWDVDFVDAAQGWIVGDDGAIFHTTNGGVDWVQQTIATEPDEDLYALTFTDPLNGWALSAKIDHYNGFGEPDDWRGSVWHTSNGGTTWTEQALPVQASLLRGIDFIDANQGWIAGIKTIDARTSFAEVESVIYYTNDGGQNWQEQPTGYETVLTDVDFISSQQGWAVGFQMSSGGDDGIILRTTDGGATWDDAPEKNSPDWPIVLWDVEFLDTTQGYAVGTGLGQFSVWQTTDGGLTWDSPNIFRGPLTFEGTSSLYGLAVSGNRLVAVGDNDFTTISENPWRVDNPATIPDELGETFSTSYINTHYQFEDVYFTDEQNGWAIGWRSYQPGFLGQVIFHTSDGGQTWQTQYEDAPNLSSLFDIHRLDSVYFTDAQNGWAVGTSNDQHEAILHTTDGGQTWLEQGQELYSSWHLEFFAVEFLDHQNGWALATDNFPSQNVFLAHTTDGGSHWNWVDTGIQGNIAIGFATVQGDVTFTDANHGWVVGGLGEIVHTDDGGITWTQQTIPDEWRRLHAVEFINNQEGWIAGQGLFHTTDGGTNWLPRDVPVQGDIRDLEFLDALNGWLSTDGGNILVTSDGGNTWNPLENNVSSAALLGISFVSPEKGWLVGDFGTILAVAYTAVDIPTITLEINLSSVSEDGTENLVYIFTRTGDTTAPLTVNYTVGGTATFNADYAQAGAASFNATTGTVTFAANSDTATVTIDPTADTRVEFDETVALTLTNGTGYTVGTTTAVTGTIKDDEVISQYANSVIAFSSQYGTLGSSASQALGAPNTPNYGDYNTAWAAASANSTSEYLTLGFNTPVYATGVTITETYGNGFVNKVETLDLANAYRQVWTGIDNSLRGSPTNFTVNFTQTDYLVKGIRITINPQASTSYEEVDAVQLHGTASLPILNQAPTALNLDHNAVAENQPIGTILGIFSTTDPNVGDTFTYSLVAGTGSTDNNLFTISGNQLKANAIFDYETKNNYSIRVKTTDQGGLSYEKQLAIDVTNVNETPNTFQYNLSATTAQTLNLTGSVIDPDGAIDLSIIDWWVQKSGGNWVNLADTTSFTPDSNNNQKGDFIYQISLQNYTTGSYTVWGQAYDKQGATSAAVTKTFEIQNQIQNIAPSNLQFNLNQTSYTAGETLSLTGAWVKDLNGSSDLVKVDLWVQKPNGQWIDLADATTFTPWSGGNEWGAFNYSLNLTNYGAGTYTLWGRASDANGAVSNPVTQSFQVQNTNPTELQFNLNQATYTAADTLTLTGAWVKDLNSSDDLVRVDLWVQKPNGQWIDLADATTFTPWTGGNEWGAFHYSLNLTNYAPGTYTLWGRASDANGAVSNEVTQSFQVQNTNPTELQFNLNQATYTAADTLTLTGAWVKDLNGSDDLVRVDMWIKPAGGNWLDISDATTFTPWTGGNEWGSFDYSLSLGSYTPGSYTLWGQASDRSGAVSNVVSRTFDLITTTNPSGIG
jgi:photosystem II stability/assembly factor-like uncharacterized protein